MDLIDLDDKVLSELCISGKYFFPLTPINSPFDLFKPPEPQLKTIIAKVSNCNIFFVFLKYYFKK